MSSECDYVTCDSSRVCSQCEQRTKIYMPNAYSCKIKTCHICLNVERKRRFWRVVYYEEYRQGMHWCSICMFPIHYIYYKAFPVEIKVRSTCIIDLHSKVIYTLFTKTCCLMKPLFPSRLNQRQCTNCQRKSKCTNLTCETLSFILLDQHLALRR
jgi:hypothetical protein